MNEQGMFQAITKKPLLMWACSLQVHAVHFARLKYWLLIGGIHLMRNFVIAFANG